VLELADELSAGPALRRIGSLADQLEIPDLAGKLGPHELADFDLELDPQLRYLNTAFRDRKWRIRWPAEPKAVRREVEH
jgi:hypothetical protein